MDNRTPVSYTHLNNNTRVVDCFFNPAGESDFSSVAATHSALIDQVVEVDEELMALYLEPVSYTHLDVYKRQTNT